MNDGNPTQENLSWAGRRIEQIDTALIATEILLRAEPGWLPSEYSVAYDAAAKQATDDKLVEGLSKEPEDDPPLEAKYVALLREGLIDRIACEIVRQSLDRHGPERLEQLDERSAKMVYLRFGVDDGEYRTPEEIGSLVGTSEQDVNETIDSALALLWREIRKSLLGGTRSDEPVFGVTPVVIFVEPGDATSEDIAELYLALSDLYRAHGGLGLTFGVNKSQVGFLEAVT